MPNPAWKSGVSGNPGGKRRDKIISTQLQLTLTEDPRRIRAIVGRLVRLAIDPTEDPSVSLRAIQLIMDRLEGKPVQEIDATISEAPVSREEREARILELQAKAQLASAVATVAAAAASRGQGATYAPAVPARANGADTVTDLLPLDDFELDAEG